MKKTIFALCLFTILFLFLFTIKDRVADNSTSELPKFRVSPSGVLFLESDGKVWFMF